MKSEKGAVAVPGIAQSRFAAQRTRSHKDDDDDDNNDDDGHTAILSRTAVAVPLGDDMDDPILELEQTQHELAQAQRDREDTLAEQRRRHLYDRSEGISAIKIEDNPVNDSIASNRKRRNMLVLLFLIIIVAESELGLLTLLSKLDFVYHSFTGKIPTEVRRLALLSELHHYSNSLTGTLPSQLGFLTALTSPCLA